MLISFCIPVHNRLNDLKQTLPAVIEAARYSPPVEVIIVDYNSPDGLADYIARYQSDCLIYRHYSGRQYYHMAHARNLTVRAAAGEYVIIWSADLYPTKPDLVQRIRRELALHHYVWIQPEQYSGAIVCERQELIDAGGYDERFEFYGPEDRDLALRLARRGAKFGYLTEGLIEAIRTPNREKIRNYRLSLSKREMADLMRPILEENIRERRLQANGGQTWGEWI